MMENKSFERIMFRREFDEEEGKEKILAIFPDDSVKSGNVGCIPFWWVEDEIWYESYIEISIEYMKEQPLVRKDDPEIDSFLDAVEAITGISKTEYKVCERMPRKSRREN